MVDDNPWLTDNTASVFKILSSLCPILPRLLCLKEILSLGLGPSVIQYDLILNLASYFCQGPFLQVMSYSEILDVHEFLGNTIKSTTQIHLELAWEFIRALEITV